MEAIRARITVGGTHGARLHGGHSATYFHPGGGEFANVASNWLLWTFKGDKQAGKMVVGNT
jgi:hypothetical protein